MHKMLIISLKGKNMGNSEIRRKELQEDIDYISLNIDKLSTVIIKEIEKLNEMKKSIELSKIEGIEIDREKNCARIFDLELYEKSLQKQIEIKNKVPLTSNYIAKLISEHTRLTNFKNEKENELAKLNCSPEEQKSKPVDISQNNTKK